MKVTMTQPEVTLTMPFAQYEAIYRIMAAVDAAHPLWTNDAQAAYEDMPEQGITNIQYQTLGKPTRVRA